MGWAAKRKNGQFWKGARDGAHKDQFEYSLLLCLYFSSLILRGNMNISVWQGKTRRDNFSGVTTQHCVTQQTTQHCVTQQTTQHNTVCQRGITSLVWQQQKLPKTVAHLVGRQSFTFDTTFSQLWQNITEITHKVCVCVTNTTMKPNDTDLFSPCEVTGVRKPPLLSTEQYIE